MGFAIPFLEAFRDDDRRRACPVPRIDTLASANCSHGGMVLAALFCVIGNQVKGAQPLSSAERCPDLARAAVEAAGSVPRVVA
jgi:hypothetical protein